jgi:hypothetical protein
MLSIGNCQGWTSFAHPRCLYLENLQADFLCQYALAVRTLMNQERAFARSAAFGW